MPVSKRDTTGGFKPEIHPREDIGRPAAECLRLDGVLQTRLLSPQLHHILLGMARIRNAVSSFRLEGETVELDRARKLIEGETPGSPSELGVLRLAKSYAELGRGKLPDFTVAGLLKLHRGLFEGILQSDWTGVLKPEQNYLINSGSGSVRFTPTPPNRTERELEELLRWYQEERFSLLPPVVAALFFAEFQAIHPFMDGNGRVGRLLNIAVLADLGCTKAPLIPLDTRFFRTSDHYYDFLGTTNAGTDYYHWTRYFVRETREAYKAAEKQANLSPVVSGFSRESTRTVLRWVLSGSGEWFSRSDYPNPAHYSQPALWSALDELKAAGVLEARGEKRGRRYRLRTRFLAEIYSKRF
ncbi:MAG TPA: Fic family protein [Thermoplasmata archaeon]|nr:Fic family protein [Thermoplasmata archaeon]